MENMRTDIPAIPVLVLSGSIGSGKSTVLGEIADQLIEAEVPHAILDLDGLTQMWPRAVPFGVSLGLENLASVWANFHAAGVPRLVLAAVIESKEDLTGLRDAIPGAQLTVCLITASLETMRERLLRREIGSAQGWHLSRSQELHTILTNAHVEDFSVSNDERSIQSVANEILHRAGWLRSV
ncbi:MAG: hypothetical protein ACYDCC_06670 [Actinomycetota bacterium]